MFSVVLYGLVACLVVRILSSLLMRRFASPPRPILWVYLTATVGLWLFALIAILLISFVIAAAVVVVVALCLAVLTAERRRRKRSTSQSDQP